MKILGIDPGVERVGIAVIEKNSSKEELLYSECLITPTKDTQSKRLAVIGNEIRAIIREFTPDYLAIETLFFNKNQKTAMMVAEARGVILYEAEQAGLTVLEYSPLQVKTAITGYGKADKRQVEMMAGKLIHIKKTIRYDDEFDAIAIALTCSATLKNI